MLDWAALRFFLNVGYSDNPCPLQNFGFVLLFWVCLRVCLLVAWTNRPPVVQKRNPVRLVKCLRRWRLLPLRGRPPLHRRQPLLLPSWTVKPRPGFSGKVTSLPLCSTAPRHELRTNIPRQGRIIKPWLCRTKTAKWSSWTVEPASSDTFLLRQFNTATRNKITQCLLESQLVFSCPVYLYWEGAAQVRFQCIDYCMRRAWMFSDSTRRRLRISDTGHIGQGMTLCIVYMLCRGVVLNSSKVQ